MSKGEIFARTEKNNVFKDGFLNIVKNKMFWYTFMAILIKSIIFMCLISDDKANGVNFSRVVFSVPPVMVYFSFIILIVSFAFIFKGKSQLWAFFIINLIITVIYIGDIWYFRSNSVFLSLYMFKMTSNLDNLGSSIISMVRLVDVLFVLDLFLQIYLIFKWSRNYKLNVRRNLMSFVLTLIIPIIYLTYAHIKIDKLNKGFDGQMIFRNSWAPNQTISNLTPIGYHFFDSYRFYEESKPYKLSETEEKNVKDWFEKKKENLPDNKYAGIFKGKNVIIIQWESLENFVINKEVEGQPITPVMNKIIKNSLYFDNFHEQVYNGTTSDAELITNTSAFPVREGTTFFRYPYNHYKSSLPNLMNKMGYTTIASHPDKGSYWNWMNSLKSIGYSKCLDSTDYNIDEKIGLGLSDRSYLNQYAKVVEGLKQPFLAYTVTLTSHSPFELPEKYKELKLDKSLDDSKLGGYFQEIRYTDKYVGEFLDTLDKKGILDNSVVVIYGDHEGPHKFYSDEVEKMNVPKWMKENGRRVPLIIYSKGMQGETLSVNGGECDTKPTLAYLLGINKDWYENDTLGRNLLNTNQDYAVLSNRTYVGKETYKGQKEDMLKCIDMYDKLIRANYFQDN